MKRRLSFIAVLVSLGAGSAMAVPIAGGSTDVTFNAAFLGLGLSVTANAPATLTGATATFPITGGDTSPLLITHSGTLTLGAGATFVELGNFTIDGTAGEVRGDVIGIGNQLSLFNIEAGLGLSLTATAAGALNGAFGTSLTQGLIVASAAPNPTTVPEPSTTVLIGGGLAAAALMRRRRRPRG